MNEKNFSTQITCRIYNQTLLKKLNRTFNSCNGVFGTKNPFLVECISRGIDAVEREICGVKNIKDINELYDEIHSTIEKLDNLILLCEKNHKEDIANSTVNQKLISCNYGMLLGLSEGKPEKRNIIEAGMLDELPERLEEILEELLKFYSNK